MLDCFRVTTIAGARAASGPQATSDTWWQLARGRGARWGVVALWVLGAVLSYSALRDLAIMLGFPDALGDLFPLVIDVAVWVGSMNALEAREHGRKVVERYAWSLVVLYSSATVAGNALVASAESVDARLVRALGDGWAHAVSGIAHAAPAVTMILFAHLAGLLMTGRPIHTKVVRRAVADPAKGVTDGLEGGPRPRPWSPPGHPSIGHATGDDRSTSVMTTTRTVVDHGHDGPIPTAMTAAEARQAVVSLVREGGGGRHVTTADVQRVTGRGPRQARRLLALAAEEAGHVTSADHRPRIVDGDR